jgi:hypothetical protein
MKRFILLSGMALCLLSCSNSTDETVNGDTATMSNTPTTNGMDTGTGTGMGNATIGADTMARDMDAGGMTTDTTRR